MLYVVDSVTRQWLEQARKAGQPLGAAAVDGSFAAGVKHVTELLPSIMTDIINTAPEPQKVRFLDMLIDYKLSRNYYGGYQSIDSHCTCTRIKRQFVHSVFCIANSRITSILGKNLETH